MIKKGQKIIINRNGKDEKWKVVEVYPHLVVCENFKGKRESFHRGDLAINKVTMPYREPEKGSLSRWGRM